MNKPGSPAREKNFGQTSVQTTRALIPLLGDDVAPRFDLAPEALIAAIGPEGTTRVEKSIVLPQASAEALCAVIMAEKVDMVVCCAIEEEYYQYLTWKKIKVIDSVMGPYSKVLEHLAMGLISDGENLVDRP
jgi:hypothetical protein